VDSVDDLGVIDAPQVHRCDREIGVAELALDDEQRHALAGHFDGVGMAQLVRRESASYSAASSGHLGAATAPGEGQCERGCRVGDTAEAAPAGLESNRAGSDWPIAQARVCARRGGRWLLPMCSS
jgi:hypothetical protein